MKRVFLFSIFCSVFLSSIFCFLFSSNVVFAGEAVLSLSPSSGSYAVGKSFTARVAVNSGGSPGVNAAEVALSFDKDIISITRVSKDGSIFSLWTAEPSFSNTKGTIVFGGGSPAPYTGSSGSIVSITFQALKEGKANISFTSGSVLAADGLGTDILSKMNPANYTITPSVGGLTPTPTATPKSTPIPAGSKPLAPRVTSVTHPDENKWYSNNNPEFSWDLPKDITGVSFSLDENLEADPGSLSDGIIKSKKFSGVGDGLWYFHIKFKNDYGWSRVVTRRALIDTASPRSFKIEVQRKNAWDSQPFLLFNTVDEISGISYYEIKIGSGDAFPVSVEEVKANPYQMPIQAPGKHLVSIKAFDNAGNIKETVAEIIVDVAPGQAGGFSAAKYWWMIVLAAMVFSGAASYFLIYKQKQKLKKEKELAAAQISKAKEKVDEVFKALKEEVEDQVKMADKKPKMSVSEQKVADKLKDAFDASEKYLDEEMDKMGKELKEEKKEEKEKK